MTIKSSSFLLRLHEKNVPTILSRYFIDVRGKIQKCCETNRNIDAVRAENYKNTCEITNAIHNEGEQTRALINANTMQDLRDKLEAKDRDLILANVQLSQQAQSANLINELRPCAKPAYLTCSPYTPATTGYGYGCGCGC